MNDRRSTAPLVSDLWTVERSKVLWWSIEFVSRVRIARSLSIGKEAPS